MAKKLSAKSSSANNDILVLDAGTTGIKAIVFRDEAILARSYVAIGKRTRKTKGLRVVEQDPWELIRASEKVIRQVLKRAGGRVRAMGITNQRETTIIWERATGRVIYPAIVWEDTRTSGKIKKLSAASRSYITGHTGLVPDAYFSASKIKWILDNVPSAKAKAKKGELAFGTVDSWLMWNMAEGHPHITDHTNASRTLLFDVQKMRWDNKLCAIFGVPENVLPKVIPSYGPFGKLRKDVFGISIPILAVAGDQEASMYAAGLKPGTTKITFGTGAFIAQAAGRKFLLQKPFFTTLTPKARDYMVEAKVNDCGARIAPLIGQEPAMEKEVARLVRELKTYIAALPKRPDVIFLDGGVTKYRRLPAIFRKMTGIPGVKHGVFEGTALGIAKLIYRHGK